MTPAQRDALDFAVGEVTRPLYDRIAELEADLKDAQEQLAERDKDLAWAEEHKEDVQDMIADAYSRGLTDGGAELRESHAQELYTHDLANCTTIAELRAQLAELEPMRPLLLALRAELLRSDRIEHYPQGEEAPAMLKIGRDTLLGIAADPLLEALHAAALAFTGETP